MGGRLVERWEGRVSGFVVRARYDGRFEVVNYGTAVPGRSRIVIGGEEWTARREEFRRKREAQGMVRVA